MSTPYADAIAAFRDTDEWKACTDPRTLGADSKQRQYLENRVLRTFEKGWDAGYEAARAEFSATDGDA